MLKVHLANGATLCFDLSDPKDAAHWLEHARSPDFQTRIRALTICRDGVSYSLPRPRDFDTSFAFAEWIPPNGRGKGSERITCHAGASSVALIVHAEQRAARVDVVNSGKLRLNPLLRPTT